VTLSDSRRPAELEGRATFLIATNCDLMKSKCAKMLSERGYVSEVASDGFHALELLTTTDFTAVILDQTLRHFTGVNLTLLSRHVPRIQTTPFFIFCASKELDNVKNMISGIDGVFVMAKPISRQKLDSILENLLLVRE
jgi:DNA-binding response OmpR family regulator